MVAEAYLLGICATVGVGARLGSAGSAVMGWRSRGGGGLLVLSGPRSYLVKAGSDCIAELHEEVSKLFAHHQP